MATKNTARLRSFRTLVSCGGCGVLVSVFDYDVEVSGTFPAHTNFYLTRSNIMPSKKPLK